MPSSAPSRGSDAIVIAGLSRELRRQLCLALLADNALRVVDLAPRADHDDVQIETFPAWRSRPARVRIFYRTLTDRDIQRFEEVAQAEVLADAVLIEAATEGTIPLKTSPLVSVVRASEFLQMLEASALIHWRDGVPAVDVEGFTFLRSQQSALLRFDSLGLRWLPSLALNKMPPALAPIGGSPERLLEEFGFRVFTMSFRLSGQRLGAASPGVAAPDAILMSAAGSPEPFGCLLDCKAARNGYRMNIDDSRALMEYVETYRPQVEQQGRLLGYVIVLSSAFPGPADRRHGYYGRAEEFKRKAGVTLVYLTAIDVVRAALRIEENSLGPPERAALDWRSLLDLGRPSRDDWRSLVDRS